MLRIFGLCLMLLAAPAMHAQQPAQPASASALPNAEMWQLMAAIETNRPVFAERKLSSAEKSEARKLSDGYKGKGQTLAALVRMRELAESGDRDAMLAIRNAIKRGVPADFRSQFADTPESRAFMTTLSDVLAALWTAHVWDRHGVEDQGIPMMAPCVQGLRDAKGKTITYPVALQGSDPAFLRFESDDPAALGCGFTLQGQLIRQYESYKVKNVLPKGTKKFEYHYFNGANHYRQAEKDFYISGVSFHPVWGDAEFLEKKFTAHIASRQRGLMTGTLGQKLRTADLPPMLQLTVPLYEYHAATTGRANLIGQTDDSARAARLKIFADADRGRARQWERMMSEFRDASAGYDTTELRDISSLLGRGYWTDFKALEAQKQPQVAAAGNADGFSGSPATAAQSVEVRNYDSSGTYTGSTQTSAVWADIMKMTSAAPR